MESPTFQAGWNLAESMLFDIANRLRSARDNLLNGNLEKYFWTLETIVRMLYGFLTEDEKADILAKEIEIQKYLPDIPQKKNLSTLNLLLKQYDGMVMTLLHNHKLLLPPKLDRTKLIA